MTPILLFFRSFLRPNFTLIVCEWTPLQGYLTGDLSDFAKGFRPPRPLRQWWTWVISPVMMYNDHLCPPMLVVDKGVEYKISLQFL
jgi:hypothetical protein